MVGGGRSDSTPFAVLLLLLFLFLFLSLGSIRGRICTTRIITRIKGSSRGAAFICWGRSFASGRAQITRLVFLRWLCCCLLIPRSTGAQGAGLGEMKRASIRRGLVAQRSAPSVAAKSLDVAHTGGQKIQ